MNRRDTVLTLLALGAVPVALEAQQTGRPAKLPVLGILSGFRNPTPEQTAKSPITAFLKSRGWIDGKTIVVEYASGEGSEERLPEIAAELVRKRVDVIWVLGPEAAVAAARATKTIPIVFHNVGLPIELGLIESYARPGRNVTGIGYVADPEIFAKLVEFLLQVVPGAKRFAYISNAGTYLSVSGEDISGVRAPVEAAAKHFNLQARHFPVKRPEDFDALFPAILDWNAHALLDLGTPLTFRERPRILAFCTRNRVPCVSTSLTFADVGALFSYGSRSHEMTRSFDYVDRILKGANPADLPVQLPSEIELVVNLKTAKALGLTVPLPLRVRADRIIE